jgi:hypothetical protein
MLQVTTSPAAPIRAPRRANLQKIPKDERTPLRAAYDKFTTAHAAMFAAKTAEADAGSIGNGTPAQKAAHRTLERLYGRTFNAAREVITTVAATPEELLLKITAASILLDLASPSEKPTTSAEAIAHLAKWDEDDIWGSVSDEMLLIAALRGDLRMMANGGRV